MDTQDAAPAPAPEQAVVSDSPPPAKAKSAVPLTATPAPAAAPASVPASEEPEEVREPLVLLEDLEPFRRGYVVSATPAQATDLKLAGFAREATAGEVEIAMPFVRRLPD